MAVPIEESEYAEYDVFLAEGFDPISFANSLVVATNNPTDVDVDLDAPTRRMRYSLEELDTRINELAGANYTEILDQASSITAAKLRLSPIKAALGHANASFAKLEKDVVAPYEHAQLYHAALKKLHGTSLLLRVLTWYLVLARQLAKQLPDGKGTATMGHETGSALFQAAEILIELRRQVETHPSLRSLKVVRAHEGTLHGVEDRIKSSALNSIKTFSIATSTDTLKNTFQALYMLNSALVSSATLSYLKAQIASSSTTLARSIGGSIATFESATSDARTRAQCLVAMTEALGRATVAGESDKRSLLGIVLNSLDVKSLVTEFWRDLASGLDSRMRDVLVRNPSAKRIVNTNLERFKDIVRSAVIAGGGVSDSGLEVKVMVNAIASMAR
jgi:hypothetical protein